MLWQYPLWQHQKFIQNEVQLRGIPSMVVEHIIQIGEKTPDPIVGRIRHYDPINNITVITGKLGEVITLFKGKAK